VATAHFLVVAVQRGVRSDDGSADGAVVSDILTVLDARASREDVALEFARTRERLARPDHDPDDVVEEALHWTTHLHAALREDFGISAVLVAQLGEAPSDATGAGDPIHDEILAEATRSVAEAVWRRKEPDQPGERTKVRRVGREASETLDRSPIDRAAPKARPDRGRPDRGRPGTMFRGSAARTGDYGMPGGEPEGPFDWAYHTGGTIRSSPVVAGGVVYIGSAGGGVHAVDAATGAARWTHPTGGAVDASPALSGGTLFITSTDGVIHALDAFDGRLSWACDTGVLGASSPAVADDVVVIGGPAHRLLALDAASGEVRWTHETAGTPADATPAAQNTADPPRATPIESSPAIADGIVYINDASLLAVDLATGRLRWAAQVSTAPTTSPAVADGVVYTSDVSGALCAVDAGTGAVRWRSAPTGVMFAFSTVAVADQTVVACGQGSVVGGPLGRRLEGGVVIALDAATGAERWRYRTEAPWRAHRPWPAARPTPSRRAPACTCSGSRRGRASCANAGRCRRPAVPTSFCPRPRWPDARCMSGCPMGGWWRVPPRARRDRASAAGWRRGGVGSGPPMTCPWSARTHGMRRHHQTRSRGRACPSAAASSSSNWRTSTRWPPMRPRHVATSTMP
jgi:outer membrane protein assembly factor BamB